MSLRPQPRAAILDIAPYTPGRSKAEGFERPIKLSANENALGCSPLARAAFLEEAASLNFYPDPDCSELRAAVAQAFTLAPDRLIFGCGSDELFSIACQVWLEPGDNIVQPAHGFAAWAIAARACGGEVKSAPERDLTVDVDAMLAQVDERTRIVFVANPANPTGTCLPDSEIRRLHAELPSDVLFLLDGAYAEYASKFDGFDDGLALAREAENVLVTRTFSKIHGLASLRIGWGYGTPAIIDAMNRIRLPFNAGRPAQAAAIAALGDPDQVPRSLAHVRRWLPKFEAAFRDLGFEPVPSATNFVTVGFPEAGALTAPAVEAALARHGILVRGLKNYGLPNHLRVTVGADEENEALLQALAHISAQSAA